MRLVSLIDTDLKRLKPKKFKSINGDLNNLFKEHERIYSETGKLPGQLTSGSDFSIHKARIAVSNPCKMSRRSSAD